MAKPSIPWAKLALEMLTIVFGVLLALVLDDWRQKRNQQKVVEAVMFSLLVELETNQRLLEARLPMHETMLDSLTVLSDGQVGQSDDPSGLPQLRRLPSLSSLGFTEGLGIDASLATSVWEASQASDVISRIGIDQLFLLSASYRTQADLRRLSERLREKYDAYSLAVVEGERPRFALLGFTSALSDLVEGEKVLCGTYQMLASKLTGGDGNAGGRCGSGHITIR